MARYYFNNINLKFYFCVKLFIRKKYWVHL